MCKTSQITEIGMVKKCYVKNVSSDLCNELLQIGSEFQHYFSYQRQFNLQRHANWKYNDI